MVFNAVSFLRDFGIDHSFTGKHISSGFVGVQCPLCNDSSYHGGFRISTGSYNCWRCSTQSPVYIISKLLDIKSYEARKIYSDYLQYSILDKTAQKRHQGLATELKLPPATFTDKEQRYLASRGLNKEIIEKYDLRGGGVFGAWKFRIVFPIYHNGEIVSATGRAIDKREEMRYYTLSPDKEIVCHKTLLLNEDFVKNDRILLVEGVLDSVKGGDGVVASFGVALTDEQIAHLTRYKKVDILFDNDDAGKKASEKIANIVATISNTEVDIVRLDKYKDIGEMPLEAIKDLRLELGLD